VADGAIDDPTVLFLHIGKTAGATMRRALRRQFPERLVLELRAPTVRPGRLRRDGAIEHFASLPEPERARPRLIVGHFTYGLHEVVPRPCVYVTLLREPVALVLSQYHHVRRHPGHVLHERAKAYPDLRSYVDSGLSLEMDNSQTRALAGDTTTPFGGCTPAMLDAAKEHLERSFRVVGITERFDESLVMMRLAFGWDRLRYSPINVNRSAREPVSQQDLELVASRNELDVELYAWASERFTAAVARTPGFQERLDRFRRQNAAYSPWGRLLDAPRRLAERLKG
jgi:hypothetical protein